MYILYISDTQLELRSKASENGSCGMILDIDDDHEKQLTYCDDCSSKFKVEALSLQQNNALNFESSTLSSSSLPSWLKDERQRLNSNHHHDHQVLDSNLDLSFTAHPPQISQNLTYKCYFHSEGCVS